MSLVVVRFDNSGFMIARSSVPSSEPSAKSLILRYTCALFCRTSVTVIAAAAAATFKSSGFSLYVCTFPHSQVS